MFHDSFKGKRFSFHPRIVNNHQLPVWNGIGYNKIVSGHHLKGCAIIYQYDGWHEAHFPKQNPFKISFNKGIKLNSLFSRRSKRLIIKDIHPVFLNSTELLSEEWRDKKESKCRQN